MEKFNLVNSSRRQGPVYQLFEDAVTAAKAAARKTGEMRYVHHGFVGFVVLTYPTPGTVKAAGPVKPRVRQAGG